MNLKEQEYVTTLARYGNITKAAQKLYISQPALSAYISNLEKSLGVRLFDRSGKYFRPTQAGDLYLEIAGKMLELNREFQDGLSEILTRKKGKLTICIQLRRAPSLLAPVLAQFGREFPDVQVTIKEGVKSLLDEIVERGDFDLLIFNLQSPCRDLVSQPIYRDQVLLALPQGHPLLSKARSVRGSIYPYLDLAECGEETFILPTPNQSLRVQVDRILENAGVSPGKVMELRNIETAMQLVAEGMGIGFNREQYERSMYYHKSPIYCRCSDEAHTDSWLSVSYPKGKTLTDYEQRIIELFVAEGNKLQTSI